MRWWTGVGVGLVSWALTGCTDSGSFACQDNEDCGDGICEVTGYCSFTDDSCASGRRYGDLAEQGLAGQCVALDEGSTTAMVPTTSDTPTTDNATTLEPTTTDTTTGATSERPSTEGTATDDSGSESSDGLQPAECGDGVAADGEQCFDADAFADFPIDPFAVDIAAGDFENIGTLGIAAAVNDGWGFEATTGSFCFYPSDGIGGYAAGQCTSLESPATRVLVVDGNGDGDSEALLMRQESIDTVHELGGFYDVDSYEAFGVGEPWVHDVTVADLDGDGVQDIAYSWAYGYRSRLGVDSGNSWSFADELGTAGIPGEGAAGLTLVAGETVGVDGSSWVGLFLNRYAPTILAGEWQNEGFGAASAALPWASFEGCSGIATGSRHVVVLDVDGDGPDDVIVTCNNGSFVGLRWTGDGFLSQQVTLAGAFRPVAGDVDRDGDDEVLIVSDTLEAAVLYDYDAVAEELSILHQFSVPGLNASGVLADLDEDGALDVAMAYTDERGTEATGGLRVWLQAP